MPLYDAKGNLISSSHYAKKAPKPITGEAFAPRWAGDLDKYIFTMPGGGVVLFDLSRLNLADFRTMRDHYQVNASLSVMTFMIHQMDWKIVCDNKRIKTMIEDNMRKIWTPLVRALSQAFWAGYSPNILQWENDLNERFVNLTKVKDLIPEECCVNWRQEEGWAPPGHIKPKILVYDGIRSWASQYPVPSENSLWYPLLMENGDYFGRKLLRPAFPSYYFSILLHLFSNRYFERFGEPVPIGRAPYDENISIPQPGGTAKNVLGADLMTQVLQNLRNRSVVVLPNDRTMIGTHGGGNAVTYDYEIEYLESQMRGADFERYMMRLDEEISIGLFTPLLILRTADVGSYNLGTTHWNMYLNMLNAIVGDMKYYLDKYVIDRLVNFNFGLNASRAEIVFRKMGDDRHDIVAALLQGMIGNGSVKPDVNELGDIAGLTFEEVQQLASNPPGDPNQPPVNDPNQNDPNNKSGKTDAGSKTKTGTGSSGSKKKTSANSAKVITDIASRTSTQINKFLREHDTDDSVFEPSFGYERQLEIALSQDGASDSARIVKELLDFGRIWIQDIPVEVFKTNDSSDILKMIERVFAEKVDQFLESGW